MHNSCYCSSCGSCIIHYSKLWCSDHLLVPLFGQWDGVLILIFNRWWRTALYPNFGYYLPVRTKLEKWSMNCISSLRKTAGSASNIFEIWNIKVLCRLTLTYQQYPQISIKDIIIIIIITVIVWYSINTTIETYTPLSQLMQ